MNLTKKIKPGLNKLFGFVSQGKSSKLRILAGSLAFGQLFMVLNLFVYTNLNQGAKPLNLTAEANLSSPSESDCQEIYVGWGHFVNTCGGGSRGGGCAFRDASNTCVDLPETVGRSRYAPPVPPITPPPPINCAGDVDYTQHPECQNNPYSRICLVDDQGNIDPNCAPPRPTDTLPRCGTYADGTPVSCPAVTPCWQYPTQPGCTGNNGTDNGGVGNWYNGIDSNGCTTGFRINPRGYCEDTSTPPQYQQPTNTTYPAGYSYLDWLWRQPSSTTQTNNQQNNPAQSPVPWPLPPSEYAPVTTQPVDRPLDSTTRSLPGYQPVNNQTYTPTPIPPPLPQFYYYPIVNEPAYKPLDLTPTQSKPSLIQKFKKIKDKALGYIFPGGGE